MIPKQKNLTDIRSKMKEREKWIVGLLKWTLNLFQKGKRQFNAILEIDDETDSLEISFYKGWDTIAGGMTIISAIITFIGLSPINDWSTLLFFKIIFDDLRGTIGTFSNFANSYASRSKDFDKFLAWFMETNGRENALLRQEFPQDGLTFTEVNISFENARSNAQSITQNITKNISFSLISKNLSILSDQVILLKGKTGAGKTQIVNALQGLLPGAVLEGIYSPIQYVKSFEYLDQHMRSSIPNARLTLRRLLNNNQDNDLLMLLVSVVRLEDKIKWITDLDAPMEGYSGGQKMKVSLLFTLCEVIREKKTVLVLDEPEQGLDPASRLDVINSVLSFLKDEIKKYNDGISIAVLLIYHGDDIDIVKLRALITKIWLFDKIDGVSVVREETNLVEYCNGIISKKIVELQAIMK
jgi:energy-coupling factor transporter ATP-binding protein EcfA2